MHDGAEEYKSFDDRIRRHERDCLGYQNASSQDEIMVRVAILLLSLLIMPQTHSIRHVNRMNITC